MKFVNFALLMVVGICLGLATMEAVNVWDGKGRPLPAWPSPEPTPYVVVDRPVTSVELVVGLADLLVKERARANRIEEERDALMEGARKIINALLEEIERLGGQHPTPALPPPPGYEDTPQTYDLEARYWNRTRSRRFWARV